MQAAVTDALEGVVVVMVAMVMEVVELKKGEQR